jgi:hypothetical protein
MNDVISKKLGTTKYDAAQAGVWSKEICSEIQNQVKGM